MRGKEAGIWNEAIVANIRVLQIFSPAANPDLSKTHDGTQQNVASRKGSTKLYMNINKYLHITACSVRMQAYGNETLHASHRTIDNEPVYVYVCVCVLCAKNSNCET
jgi:hypothetical protein